MRKPDEITIYNAAALGLGGLSRGGTILLAIIAGGDYDAGGFTKVGYQAAIGLARAGFGDSLLDAAQRLDDDALAGFLITWRTQLLVELQTNSMGFLKSKRPSARMKSSWPAVHILRMYTNPAVSSRISNPDWKPDVPRFAALARFCNEKFGWSADTIFSKFKSLVFPGAATRRLEMPDNFLSDYDEFGIINDPTPPLSSYMQVVAAGPNHLKVKVMVGAMALASVSQFGTEKLSRFASQSILRWLPTVAMQLYFPKMKGVPPSPQAARPAPTRNNKIIDLTEDDEDDEDVIDLTGTDDEREDMVWDLTSDGGQESDDEVIIIG
ncbi:PIN domain-like protein [Mycena kentingensis (nom. inval.)]|nr:PIN domain-like protein [Mycena kentingensis (nom. inval.)]